MTAITKLEKLIEELIIKVDKLSTTDNLEAAIEAASAKIIKDVSDKIDNNKLKFDSLKKDKTFEGTKSFQKYSFPNFDVGNPSLGSSKSPNALTWPFGSKSNDS